MNSSLFQTFQQTFSLFPWYFYLALFSFVFSSSSSVSGQSQCQWLLRHGKPFGFLLCLSGLLPSLSLCRGRRFTSARISGLWRKSDERKGGSRQTHFTFFRHRLANAFFRFAKLELSWPDGFKIAFSPSLQRWFRRVEFIHKLSKKGKVFLNIVSVREIKHWSYLYNLYRVIFRDIRLYYNCVRNTLLIYLEFSNFCSLFPTFHLIILWSFYKVQRIFYASKSWCYFLKVLFRAMDELFKLSDRLNLYRIFQDEERLQMIDVSPKRKGININLHNCSEKRARDAEAEAGGGERAGRERCERFKLCVPMRR